MALFIFEDFINGIRGNLSNLNFQKVSYGIEILQDEGYLEELLTGNQFFYHKGTVRQEEIPELYFFNKKEIIVLKFEGERSFSIHRSGFEVEKIELNNLSFDKKSVDLVITLKNGEVFELSREKDSNEKTINQYFRVILEIYKYLIN